MEVKKCKNCTGNGNGVRGHQLHCPKRMELNKIHNTDCLEFMRNLPDKCIDLILTDPPYLVTSRGSSGNSGGMLQKEINKSGNVFEYNSTNVKDYLPEFYRVLKDSTHCYIMCNHTNLREMLNTSQEVGFEFTKCLIWDKGNKIMGQFYMSQFEYILFLRKGEGKKINDCGTSDLIRVENKKIKNKDGSNLHDTEKPVELMAILIKNSTNENDIVFDPFMGIGATAIACKMFGRNYIGCEIDKNYYQTSLERIKSISSTLF